MSSCLSFCAFDAEKKDVIDFCRKGVIPLTFHEKTRMLFGSNNGRAWGTCTEGVCFAIVAVEPADVLRLLAGGGLISRLMLACLRYIAVDARTKAHKHRWRELKESNDVMGYMWLKARSVTDREEAFFPSCHPK
jgi:hypothetical protein